MEVLELNVKIAWWYRAIDFFGSNFVNLFKLISFIFLLSFLNTKNIFLFLLKNQRLFAEKLKFL